MATVKETYKKRQSEINNQIKLLQLALDAHAKKFEKNETNWGYVGDLGHIKDSISDLTTFLK